MVRIRNTHLTPVSTNGNFSSRNWTKESGVIDRPSFPVSRASPFSNFVHGQITVPKTMQSPLRGPAWQATKLDPSRSYSGRGQGTGTSEGSRGVGVAKGIFPSSPLHSLVPVPSSRIRQCKHQQETTGTESGFGFAKRRTLVEGNWRVLLFMFCLISISREENVVF